MAAAQDHAGADGEPGGAGDQRQVPAPAQRPEERDRAEGGDAVGGVRAGDARHARALPVRDGVGVHLGDAAAELLHRDGDRRRRQRGRDQERPAQADLADGDPGRHRGRAGGDGGRPEQHEEGGHVGDVPVSVDMEDRAHQRALARQRPHLVLPDLERDSKREKRGRCCEHGPPVPRQPLLRHGRQHEPSGHDRQEPPSMHGKQIAASVGYSFAAAPRRVAGDGETPPVTSRNLPYADRSPR